MCLFIYTLSERCGHRSFQNVAECPVARGIEHPHTAATRRDATLTTPKFLFDTARSKTHTPESYTRIFACQKRKAIRPVPGALCDECIAKEAAAKREKSRLLLLDTMQEEKREEEKEKEEDVGGLVVPKTRMGWGRGRSASSASSSVALVGAAAGPSASSTTSSLITTSDTSTTRSIWKAARPSDVF
ncbi:unnamed protein product [Discula destructiva]